MKKLLITPLILLSTISFAKEYTTMKTSCIQQSEHAGKTLDQQKEVLINQAKQLALTDLYGEMMFSKTDMSNGKITSDEIRQRAVGAVRLKGNPSFYNGKNFGEVCADVTAYVTDKDIERFSPKEVTLNKYCFNNPNVAMNKIKQEAKYGAYKEIISQYKPSLKLSGEQAEKLIHGFKISNDNFDFDTASYCFNAVATILPYELEMGKIEDNNVEKKVPSEVKVTKRLENLNFETGSFSGWNFSGDMRILSHNQGFCGGSRAKNIEGNYFLASGDKCVGYVRSKSFIIPDNADYFTFLRAGGADAPSGFYVRRTSDGSVICQDNWGKNTNNLTLRICRNLKNFIGENAYIEIRDDQSSGWGKVYIDNIVLHETMNNKKNYIYTPNAAISGHNTKHLNNVSVEDCKRECDDNIWCKSFDYYKGSNACDLSKQNQFTVNLKTNYSGNPYDHYTNLNRK